jgi:hypothetical protein
LLEVFREYPYAKATVNVQGVLTEMLFEAGFSDIIAGMRELGERGQFEFTGSAKYHPILPLIPQHEMKRQISRNYLTNRNFFGEVYSPRGFFLPEMCYSEDVVESLLESRHEWLILSGVACPVQWPMTEVYELEHFGERLAVFFRDDVLSNKICFQSISGDGFIEHLKQLYPGEGDIYVITAMDAETFGHHIQNWEKLFLAEVYEALERTAAPYLDIKQLNPLAQQHKVLLEFDKEMKRIEMVTISQLLELFPRGAAITPKPSSWGSSAEDIEAGNFYPLWQDENNPLHRMQWEHISICLDLVAEAMEVADNADSERFASIARGLMDPALHSCQFWWASKRPWWDINMIYRGLVQQREVVFNAYRAIWSSGCSPELKREYYYRVLASRDLSNKIADRLMME